MADAMQGLVVTFQESPQHVGAIDARLAGVPGGTWGEAESAVASYLLSEERGGRYTIFEAARDDPAPADAAGGPVADVVGRSHDLLTDEPVVERVEILAEKLGNGEVTKAVLLRLPIKESHRDDAAAFLQEGRAVVEAEPTTVAWFALRFGNGDVGVFDVFPDNRARRAHLMGRIPQQLVLHGLPWLSGFPRLTLLDVNAVHGQVAA